MDGETQGPVMEFEGAELSTILARQEPAALVEIWGPAGSIGHFAPKEARAMIGVCEYVGIGHRRRIRYVRPKDIRLNMANFRLPRVRYVREEIGRGHYDLPIPESNRKVQPSRSSSFPTRAA